ncbi:MAG: hypothetical protein CVV64_05455 [Candidatus Wallbacteria bacterium HGW-Wallbacteria-1]|jgi:hypothetical protein|uniref:FMN-binding domain-containing protein n=1 Tax=Candidatus Wallbacteria bacterium HGW-Wallbacteria-1 TaxID=2013854 RepID=A0A2N1PSA1_9BACT|nr:MAG: hypothetical protein CVV64_05455 [Candidatus Wallbacteria bacterium HGW-Wallbacteria-1]
MFHSVQGKRSEAPVEIQYLQIDMESVRAIFSLARKLQISADNSVPSLVMDFRGNVLGSVIAGKCAAIPGNAGPVPVVVGLDLDGGVAGVALMPSRETQSYIARIMKSGLLSAWNGFKPASADKVRVDTVSGATRTSKAVIRTVEHILSRLDVTVRGN